MKCLVIHPEDESTTFLKVIYAHLRNKTVITGGVSKSSMVQLIKEHDRVMMMGHGSPSGLFAIGQFLTYAPYIIDQTIVPYLKEKKDNVFIWCNANRFVVNYGLEGFYSGMFVSQIDEALYCGILDVNWEWISESNDGFSSICSKYINEPIDVLHKNLLKEYGLLTHSNPIAKYNHDRLFLKTPNTQIYGCDKIHTEI